MDIEKSINFVKDKVLEFEQTRAVKFDHIHLQTMKNLYKEIYGETLNLSCRPCVIRCADKLALYIHGNESKESELTKMKMPQLRELARSMGVKVVRSKEEIIYNIENNVEE